MEIITKLEQLKKRYKEIFDSLNYLEREILLKESDLVEVKNKFFRTEKVKFREIEVQNELNKLVLSRDLTMEYKFTLLARIERIEETATKATEIKDWQNTTTHLTQENTKMKIVPLSIKKKPIKRVAKKKSI